MFEAQVYARRRRRLRTQLGGGLALFLGHEESPMNYAANQYPFRQDGSFLYFFGLDTAGLAGIVDIDENRDVLFADDIGMEDIIWMGYLPTVKERAKLAGVRETRPAAALGEYLRAAAAKGRTIHFLPPYRAATAERLRSLLGVPLEDVKPKASPDLVRAVVEQRSVKSDAEVAEIERALAVTREMYLFAMKTAKPGRYERDVAGGMEGIALSRGLRPAFPLIVTVNGQILHNHEHGNALRKGRMLVVDAGAESPMHYAADITRTIPVGGRFDARQKDVYAIVLEGQESAIRAVRPGVLFRDVHLETARIMAGRLKDLGLLKGDPAEAVAQGAHALFFPHGLGHMLGLDVHDMEGLGEKNVGYTDDIRRSEQFGLAYLRMAKALRPGYVMTVEPGLYFIPALTAQWRKAGKHRDFIAYDKVETFLDFGGVRIEDNVLVTGTGRRVLGKRIPKTVAEIERAAAA